jgi:hypothetical protein
MMGIIRTDRDGKNREVLARGVRNSVGLDFNPKDKTRWFAGKQVAGMGDNTPPGEVNRASKAGLHFDTVVQIGADAAPIFRARCRGGRASAKMHP